MEDTANELLVSPASLWEIAIKISLGKYQLNEDYATFIQRQFEENELTLLPISIPHTAQVAALPFHHRDPFDRLIVAQAMVEQVPLVSSDKALDDYPIVRMW